MKQSRRLFLPRLPHRIASDGWWLVSPPEPRLTVAILTERPARYRASDIFGCAA